MTKKQIQTTIVILLTVGLIIFLYFEYSEIQNLEISWWDITVDTIAPIDNTSWSEINNEGWIINSWSIFINNNCDYNSYSKYLSWSDYSVIRIFDKPEKSPLDFSAYRWYTNRFNVSGKFEELYLCISANVVERRQNNRFYYTTYVLFNDPEYAWHIRVWYSPTNNVLYDKTSSPSEPFLDWRFWWSDTPKIYQLDISNELIVADREAWLKDKKWKPIHPMKRLNDWWILSIWWFVNARNQEWIIEDYLLIYKGWSIVRQ